LVSFGFLLSRAKRYTCTLAPNARTDEPALPQTFQCDNLCLDRLGGGSSSNAGAVNFCLITFKRRVAERKPCLMPRHAVQPCILCLDTHDDYCNPCIPGYMGGLHLIILILSWNCFPSRGFFRFHGMCEQLCLRGSTLRSVTSIHGPLGYGPKTRTSAPPRC